MRLLRLLFCALWIAAAGTALPARAQPTPAGAEDPAKVLVLLRLPTSHFRAGSEYSGGYGDEVGRNARRRIAGQLAGELGLKMLTDWPMPILGVDCYVMSVPAGRSAEEVAKALSRDKRVSWAEPLNIFHAQAATADHADPLFAAQPAAVAWHLNDLHDIATGMNVRVAVIDSMVDTNHPDLSGQIQTSRNFAPEHGSAPELHGTSVAGVIAARADNGVGIVGVAPRARLLALRACWQKGAGTALSTVCDTLSLAKALDFAIDQNVQVINMSLSGPRDTLLGKLIDVAISRGITVVGAVDPGLARGGFPASHPGVVAAAEDTTGLTADGIVVAPGRGIPTTVPGGRWFLVNGSSYAAAHVSGLFALLHERRSARLGAPILVMASGGGSRDIDACASLLRTPRSCDCVCPRPAVYSAVTRP